MPNGGDSAGGNIPSESPITGNIRVSYPGRNADASINYTELVASNNDSATWAAAATPFWNDPTKFWSLPQPGCLLLNPFASSQAVGGGSFTLMVAGMANASFPAVGCNNGPAIASNLGILARFVVSLQSRFPAFTVALPASGQVGSGPGWGNPSISATFSVNNGGDCQFTTNNLTGQLSNFPAPTQAPGTTAFGTPMVITFICRDIDTDGVPIFECWVEHDGISHSPHCIGASRFTVYSAMKTAVVSPAIKINYVPGTLAGAVHRHQRNVDLDGSVRLNLRPTGPRLE